MPRNVYPLVTKYYVLRRLQTPDGEPVAEVSADTGIAKSTLCRWTRIYARWLEHIDVRAAARVAKLEYYDKLGILLDTRDMGAVERFDYCLNRDLYPELLDAWERAIYLIDFISCAAAWRKDGLDALAPGMLAHEDLTHLTDADAIERLTSIANSALFRLAGIVCAGGMHYESLCEGEPLTALEPIPRDFGRQVGQIIAGNEPSDSDVNQARELIRRIEREVAMRRRKRSG